MDSKTVLGQDSKTVFEQVKVHRWRMRAARELMVILALLVGFLAGAAYNKRSESRTYMLIQEAYYQGMYDAQKPEVADEGVGS